MAGVVWLVGSLAGLAIVLVTSTTWALVTDRLGLLIVPLAAGFAAQVLLGAMSFLVPVVLGGGPTILRGTQSRMDRGSALRAVLINLGLLVAVLPVPPLVRVLVSMLVLGAFAAFLPLLVGAVLYARRAKSAVDQAADPAALSRYVPDSAAVVRGRHTGLAAVALALVVLAVAGGVALDPVALGNGVAQASGGVVATGRVTTVSVVASHMRFVPASVDVPAGNRLVLIVTNKDADVHDLALETGQSTSRITRGTTVRLNVGIVGRSLRGWCTIVGHRQMGMVFAVNAIGQSTGAATRANPGGTMSMHGATAPMGTRAKCCFRPGLPGPTRPRVHGARRHHPGIAATGRTPPPRHHDGQRGRTRGRRRGPAKAVDLQRHRAGANTARPSG